MEGLLTMSRTRSISEELELKICAYVEREAGRDPLLSPEDQAMVRELLATNPAAQALADEFRKVDRDLEAMFRPFHRVSDVVKPEEMRPLMEAYWTLRAEGKPKEAEEFLDRLKEKR